MRFWIFGLVISRWVLLELGYNQLFLSRSFINLNSLVIKMRRCYLYCWRLSWLIDHHIFFPLFLLSLLYIRYKFNDKKSFYLWCDANIDGYSLKLIRRKDRGRYILKWFLNELTSLETCWFLWVVFYRFIICFTIISFWLVSRMRFAACLWRFIWIFTSFRRKFLGFLGI